MAHEHDLPLPPSVTTPLAPPRGFRTDTIGLFLVLMFSGIGAVLNTTPGAVSNVAEGSVIVILWEVNLVIFGALGLVGCLLPRRWAVLGRGMELIARIVLGLSSLAYAVAVYEFRGLGGGTSVIVFLGLSMLMLVGASQIWRWLRAQRRAVDVLKEFP